MTEEQKQNLLEKYEKIKGYSSEIFNNEEWEEFNSFCFGYFFAYEELNQDVENLKKQYESLNELFDKITNIF